MKFVGRLSGIVTYSDQTTGQFAAHIDEIGNVSVNAGDAVNLTDNLPNDSNQTMVEVFSKGWLTSVLNAVTGSGNPITLSLVGTPVKTVTDAVIHFSGRVSRDDNTWGDYAAEYMSKTGVHVLTGSEPINQVSGPALDNVAEIFTSGGPWFEALIGDGNVSV